MRDARAQREYVRYMRLQRELRRWVADYKLSQGCSDCGFNRWPEALHFDHVDPSSKRRELGWRDDRTKITSKVQAGRYTDHVIRFCVVRCANCHAHRSRVEEHWRPTAVEGGEDTALRLF